MTPFHRLENTFEVGWKSPSNLALVKYWGKYGRQYPKNASISFTLDHAHSMTNFIAKPKTGTDLIDLSFKFEGENKPAFENKIKKFFESILDITPFLQEYTFEIESKNSFPHSSGIASSASAMSALSLCIMSLEQEIREDKLSETDFLKKASFLSRLGSGSASRSVYPNLAMWGEHRAFSGSSNDYAIPYYDQLNPIFLNFHDDILIVSKSEKSVSSTAGHALMDDNVYSSQRYQQANDRLEVLIAAMKEGNLDDFGKIVEDEALTLHALMMCSQPSYILIEPNTLNLIKSIRDYRNQTGVPVYFSLDAGPNIHLLYPDEHKEHVKSFIQDDLEKYCLKIIEDQVGQGPSKLNSTI